MNLTDLDLGRKVGPLPVGGWLAILGLGLGAAWLIRRGSGDAWVPPTDSGVGVEQVGDPLSGFASTSVDAVTPVTPSEATPGSNQAWLTQAARNLQALRRPYAPAEIVEALTRFVSGESRTDRQTTIVNDAITVTGYPPEPLPLPPQTGPAPAPVNPTAPGQPGYERVPPNLVPKAKLGTRRTRVLQVGSRGERPDEIARRVYGSSRYANTLDWINESIRPPYTSPLPVGLSVAY